MPTAQSIILWFRSDLRLQDNPALKAAHASGRRIIPAFIHSPGEERPWPPGEAARWWLFHSLRALDAALRQRGSRLLVQRGPTVHTLVSLLREAGASAVYWNRRHEPAATAAEEAVQSALESAGVECRRFDAALLHNPEEILSGQGTPYRIFTAFWKRARQAPPSTGLSRAPDRLSPLPRGLRGLRVEELGLLPPGKRGPEAPWRPGEAGALEALAKFVGDALADYPDARDRPGTKGTSKLSPHLHFGEISPLRVLASVRGKGHRIPLGAAEAFERQLYWREFAHYILHHFPHTAEHPLDGRFERFAWTGDENLLLAWQKGITGYPMVDAGMRELAVTGWMHNRSRLVTASLLTKNLRIHWLEGARWFWEHLVDADLANNSFGWQWTAGCGADASPFFRVFNPTRQGERFDSEGEYVRRWVPEIAGLPNRWIHHPWEAPPTLLATAKITLGTDYPLPVVDFSSSRERALLAYRKMPRRTPSRGSR